MTGWPCKAKRGESKARSASLLLPGRVGRGQPPAGASRVLLVAACTHARMQKAGTYTHRTPTHISQTARVPAEARRQHVLSAAPLACTSAVPSRTDRAAGHGNHPKQAGESCICLHARCCPSAGVRPFVHSGPKRTSRRSPAAAPASEAGPGALPPRGGEVSTLACMPWTPRERESLFDHITQTAHAA